MPRGAARNIRHLALLLLLLLQFVVNADGRNFRLGVLAPVSGSWPVGRTILGAATVTVDEIMSDASDFSAIVGSGHSLSFMYENTDCNAATGLERIVHLWSAGHVDAFIGPGCDDVCYGCALLAGKWGMPIISWGCMLPEFSDKTTFPTFYRTVSPYQYTSQLVIGLMRHYGWRRLALITVSDPLWQLASRLTKVELQEAGFEVHDYLVFDVLETRVADSVKHVYQDAVNRSRVILFYAHLDEVTTFMQLYGGNLDDEYAVLAIDMFLKPYAQTLNLTVERTTNINLYEGIINIVAQGQPNINGYADFQDGVRNAMAKEPFNMPMEPWERVDVFASYLRQAILLYAHALNATLARGVAIDNVTAALIPELFATSFWDTTDPVRMNSYGDKKPSYVLYNIRNGSQVEIGTFLSSDEKIDFRDDVSITWPSGRTDRPTGEPRCGWENEHCEHEHNNNYAIVASIACVCGSLVISGLAIIIYRLKNAKINSRPKNMGQEIPRSALELQKLMNSKNIGKKRKNKYHKDHARQPIQEKGMEKVVQPVPTFKQKMGESNNSYFNRMDKEVQAAKQRAEFEVKWDVEVTQQRDNKVYVKPATPLESVQRKTKQKSREVAEQKKHVSLQEQKQALDFTRTDKVEFGR
ncbi:PREDICTED: guanylate cyclase 2G-like [Priapulus caudatus]|uniref:Guanylate cyclase 2G-like n=1 Tax=Priapulus caudatus TaxID=37621 RepID=A0ABM1E6E6_PRICU|nr:PREDICTED: guanylate cyclase 2G-like [Priapulus caudatus]